MNECGLWMITAANECILMRMKKSSAVHEERLAWSRNSTRSDTCTNHHSRIKLNGSDFFWRNWDYYDQSNNLRNSGSMSQTNAKIQYYDVLAELYHISYTIQNMQFNKVRHLKNAKANIGARSERPHRFLLARQTAKRIFWHLQLPSLLKGDCYTGLTSTYRDFTWSCKP